MKNPFKDFQPDRYNRQPHRAEAAQKAKDGVMGNIVQGYRDLLIDEVKQLTWVVEHAHIVTVYDRIVRELDSLAFKACDIETFCAAIDQDRTFPAMVPGPLGLYVSALINHALDPKIELSLDTFDTRFHFLGYRLPPGKTLILEGATGDFTGAALDGGHLTIVGATGNWCGAGMRQGAIRVDGSAGNHTGQWMHGGTIHIGGPVGGVGDTRYGGQIFDRNGRHAIP